MDKIYLATGNKGKAREAQQILPIEVEIVELELDEIQSLNPDEIVSHKAKQAYQTVKAPIFVDDVSLQMDIWKGFPGPFIKYIDKAGGNELLLYMLKHEENRNASLVATIGYFNGEKMSFFKGEIRVTIAKKQRGTNGWGLDPILVPEGSDKTYAEMTEEEKNSDSHRKRALEEFRKFLDSQTGSNEV